MRREKIGRPPLPFKHETLNVQLPRDVVARLRRIAAQRTRGAGKVVSLSQIVRDALAQYLGDAAK